MRRVLNMLLPGPPSDFLFRPYFQSPFSFPSSHFIANSPSYHSRAGVMSCLSCAQSNNNKRIKTLHILSSLLQKYMHIFFRDRNPHCPNWCHPCRPADRPSGVDQNRKEDRRRSYYNREGYFIILGWQSDNERAVLSFCLLRSFTYTYIRTNIHAE